ncbi:PREDICTED: auxin-induced in root cultures protein 12-like [Ipomoea nil]|uniref:auxin-induced in root cultures protein 12-like n=1 Tax=Ipomoea nil TaxID=35883 RepID=UPI000900BE3B|nr:PREDICTED: auxin-induced in root cultures protein 12-like [Ipomoea nil]
MSSFSPLLSLLLLLGALLISPAVSLQCTSQTFSTKAHYANCSDLPTLKAFLHWTYNQTKSTLSVAFVAPPAAADGWIAWGINPTATGMIGTQAFIAFKDPQGKVAVKTYNLTSYGGITPQKLSLKVLDSRAEAAADGVMRIFATVELPEKMATVNHVWQVGASVKDGVPQKHQMSQENLDAKSTLDLTAAGNTISKAPSPAPTAAAPGGDGKKTAISPASGQTTGNDAGGASRNWKSNMNLHAFFTVVGIFGLVL